MERTKALALAVGDMCMAMRCQDEAFLSSLTRRYGSFVTARQPDFWLDLELRRKLSVAEINDLLPQVQAHWEDGFLVTEPRLFECRVDWTARRAQVATERELFSPGVEYRFMNDLIRGIYYGTYRIVRRSGPPAYFVHGCGILDGSQGYLFTGPPGAGKTTIARLAGDRRVLNDEVVLVGEGRDGFYLAATPLDGGASPSGSAAGPLRAIYFLRHGSRACLRRLGTGLAFARILLQIWEPCPLLLKGGAEAEQERADLAAALAARVPCYELSFRQDTSFWKVVNEV